MIPKPLLEADRLFDIPLEFLKENNIELVLLDLDNTLAPWHSYTADEKTAAWVKTVQGAGIKTLVLTNGSGKKAEELARALSLEIVNNAKKPFISKIKKCLCKQNASAEQTLIIGDQLFTDIFAANRIKAKSVLLQPISKREWWATKAFNRTRERLAGRKIKYFE